MSVVTVASPQDPFRCGTLIPEDEFERELRKKGAYDTPLFNGYPTLEAKQAAARRAYRRIVEGGHSAEAMLGIMGREHSWGTNPDSVLHRNDTRSMGNARSVRDPSLPRGTYRTENGQKVKNMDGWYLIRDAKRDGSYVQYMRFEDSVQDFVYRLNEPGYAYDGKVSIGDVVATIAPKEDSNDPEGYAWFLVNVITGLRSRLTDPIPGGDSVDIPFVPADRRHFTPGRTVPWPTMIIGHHTDGWDSLYWLTESPNSDVSATYLLNHDGSIRAQLVRHRDTPHTTGYMNPLSLSWEWERKWPEQREISDAQYREIARSNATIWRIEAARGNPNFSVPPTAEQINRHRDYYSTTCPGNLDMDRVWREVVEELSAPEIPEVLIQPGNPFGEVPIVLGFRVEVLRQAAAHYDGDIHGSILAIFGWAKGPEYETAFGSAQEFEKGVLTWHRDNDPPFDIQWLQRDAELPAPKAA